MYCDNVDSTASVEGFTIRGGDVIASEDLGGGVYCVYSSPQFCSVTFFRNRALHGGGVYCDHSSPKFTNVTFSLNCTTDDGGGVYCLASSPSFIDCTFIANRAMDCGGGMFCESSSPSLTGCSFTENLGVLGGGLVCAASSQATLTGCSFSDNTADCGSGVFCRASSPTITDCVFAGNEADYHGAGIYSFDGACPAVSYCVFCGDSAGYDGAGVCCHDTPFTLTHCTFCGNSAGRQGGGIRLAACPCATLENTIIAFGIQGEAVSGDPYSSAALSCCDICGNCDGDWVGCIEGGSGVNGNISLDPLFCDAPGGDYSISMYSPCAPDQSPPGCGLIGALGFACGVTGVATAERQSGGGFYLTPSVPNPFNPVTRISYFIPGEGANTRVLLRIYDATGRRVRTLVDASLRPGEYTAVWDGTNDSGREVASGVYFCALRWGRKSATSRMVLMR